jgi:hypothetical protein
MNKSFSVARTAAGLSHRNTLIVPKVKTVVVFIDQPHLSSGLQDGFRLIGKESSYDCTMQRSEAIEQDELHVSLRFTQVPAAGSYSLYHVLTKEIEIPVFLDVPFEGLLSYGEEGTPPARGEQVKPSLAGPPQPELDDLLLHVNARDSEPDSSRYLDLLAYRTQKPEESEAA